MKGFGLDRAAEPKGSIPVTAWKLDDSPELRPGGDEDFRKQNRF